MIEIIKNKLNDSDINGYIQVGIDSKHAMIPTDNLVDKINSYEQYIKEKDSCVNNRLMFNINILSSNILCNTITEIVRNEGGNNVEFIKEENGGSTVTTKYNYYTGRSTSSNGSKSLKRSELIQDTAYSSCDIFSDEVPYVYHCGLDIFNNHTLRRKEFSVINKVLSSDTSRNNFNTLKDFNRDYFGNKVTFNKISSSGDNGIVQANEHKYTNDNAYSYQDSLLVNLVEKDGWIGFKNPSTLAIPNVFLTNTGITINKCMNNNESGEFIDLYPDRTLFSMVPKINKKRKRLEYNWDYCLTYPYSNETDNDLINGGIKCEYFTGTTKSGGLLTFRTLIKNNFRINTNIYISFGEKTKTNVIIENVGIGGEYTDYYFTILYDSVIDIFNNTVSIRVGRMEGGTKCQYYIRKFRKLPNFNRIGINPETGLLEKDLERATNNKFSTTLNKLAFAQNAFGENITQIIYNDVIKTNGLVDNLGRPLTEVYLTIIKRNKGYLEWYYEDNKNSSNVEFSHCFGPISSGFDLPLFSKKYNVHKIHNINSVSTLENDVLNYINKSASPLSTGITVDDTVFDGDIVEFSPTKLSETVLEDVYYRFNTAQREIISDEYNTFKIDEIIYDDYDYEREGGQTNFKVVTVDYGAKINEYTTDGAAGLKNVNLNPEGYYYKPHFKVQLRKFEDVVNSGAHQLIGTIELNNEYIEVFNEATGVVKSSTTNENTKNTKQNNKQYINEVVNDVNELQETTYSKPLIVSDSVNILETDVPDTVSTNGIVTKTIRAKLEEVTLSLDKKYYISVGDTIYVLDPIIKKRYENGYVTKKNGKKITIVFGETIEFYSNTIYFFKPNILKPLNVFELYDVYGTYIWRNIESFGTIDHNTDLFNTTFTNNSLYYENNINLIIRRQDPFREYDLMDYSDMPNAIKMLLMPGEYTNIDSYEYVDNNYTS